MFLCCMLSYSALALVSAEVHTLTGQPQYADQVLGMHFTPPDQAQVDSAISSVEPLPSFISVMEKFHGNESLQEAASWITVHSSLDVPLTADKIRNCAPDPSCTDVWTTSTKLAHKRVVVTDVIGSFELSKGGEVCHATSKENVYCHKKEIDGVFAPGIAWFALAVPEGSKSEALPLLFRCHKYGMGSMPPCHLLSGTEFAVAPKSGLDAPVFRKKTAGNKAGASDREEATETGNFAPLYPKNVDNSVKPFYVDNAGAEAKDIGNSVYYLYQDNAGTEAKDTGNSVKPFYVDNAGAEAKDIGNSVKLGVDDADIVKALTEAVFV